MSAKHTPGLGSLPPLLAVAWSNHARTTLRGEVDGVHYTFAECSGNGLHSVTNEEHAASIAHRCNSHAELLEALRAAEEAARLDDEYQELLERAHAEGWDSDPTGSSHLSSAGTRASNAMNLAVQLRRAAIAKAEGRTHD